MDSQTTAKQVCASLDSFIGENYPEQERREKDRGSNYEVLTVQTSNWHILSIRVGTTVLYTLHAPGQQETVSDVLDKIGYIG